MTQNTPAPADLPFQREERYIVIKRKFVDDVLETQIRAMLACSNVPTIECVVVESDWPEYETVWGMIERRVTGQPAAPADLVEAVARVIRRIRHTVTSEKIAIEAIAAYQAHMASDGVVQADRIFVANAVLRGLSHPPVDAILVGAHDDWHLLRDAAAHRRAAAGGKDRELLLAILAAQKVQPYNGWSITELNKAVDAARFHLGLPSIRDLNPNIAAMQDRAREVMNPGFGSAVSTTKAQAFNATTPQPDPRDAEIERLREALGSIVNATSPSPNEEATDWMIAVSEANNLALTALANSEGK